MKILVVAHPDDEILWFNPLKFDKIIIAFMNRSDRPAMGVARAEAIQRHPLRNKIELAWLIESNYWRDKRKLIEYENNSRDLVEHLQAVKMLEGVQEFYTHNAWGEYGHTDHILVHKAVMAVAGSIPVYCLNGPNKVSSNKGKLEDIDLKFYNKVKKIYQEEGAWTWAGDYEPEKQQSYFQANKFNN